jgi:hypothetical protein
MQFQVKGQDYFLAFVEEEKGWFLFSQAGDGLMRIPVYVDGGKLERNKASQKNSTRHSS